MRHLSGSWLRTAKVVGLAAQPLELPPVAVRGASVTVSLTYDEWESLRCSFSTSNIGRGGTRYMPFAFTEQGVAMLSSVLKSDKAIDVNVSIMRAFVMPGQKPFLMRNWLPG